MHIVSIEIQNFRGIRKTKLLLPEHAVLIGDNNTGKTTLLEALDLVLGPDRLSRQPVIDEHDFFRGIYRGVINSSSPIEQGENESSQPNVIFENEAPKIIIEVVIINLTAEQKREFNDVIEFWDSITNQIVQDADIARIDNKNITEALRVTFHGWYDVEEDDFKGATYFSRSLIEDPKPMLFTKKHKYLCGFLFLRTIRTGSRALSLERGSLLDIILRLKEVRPQMWESTLQTLMEISVADDPSLGISPILESINTALNKYVPKEWGVRPHLKVSNLTREHLRKVITAFIATGDGTHAAPFYRQGTGTINMLVLAMLSQIAESRQNVIFAMEEPETAIPPYAQKRIVHELCKLASQTIFTSHSPYVLEEFDASQTIVLTNDPEGTLLQRPIELPSSIKLKRYRQEFRTRFCEGLLARRVLIAEGATEYTAFSVVCRRLAELDPENYSSLEALGICIIDADGETNIPSVAELYKSLGKKTFAICDRQNSNNKDLIEAQVEMLLMHEEVGIEDLILNGAKEEALNRFAKQLDIPQHLQRFNLETQTKDLLKEYFCWSKANWGIADFLAQCSKDEIPLWLCQAASRLKEACMPLISDENLTSINTEHGR